MFAPLRFAHGETIDMLRDSVAAFAAAEIAPRAAEIDASNRTLCKATPMFAPLRSAGF